MNNDKDNATLYAELKAERFMTDQISLLHQYSLPEYYSDYPCNHSKRFLLITGVSIIFTNTTGLGKF